jgi:hypothetical protein
MLRALLVLGVAAPAAAHVAASPDANNRYLKVTLLPASVRVAYSLIVGERPGRDERRRMDADGDGTLDAGERARYGAEVAARLAPAVSLDGAPARGWRVADVGLGEPTVAGGSFAVDLVLELPYADPRADEHRLAIDDAAAVPLPGESELRIDESPGVRVLEAHLASSSAGIELVYAHTGNATRPGERAVTVRFGVDRELRPARRWPLAALVAAAVAIGLLALSRRRRAGLR